MIIFMKYYNIKKNKLLLIKFCANHVDMFIQMPIKNNGIFILLFINSMKNHIFAWIFSFQI